MRRNDGLRSLAMRLAPAPGDVLRLAVQQMAANGLAVVPQRLLSAVA